ncbi:hypothetical protein [Histidinibacterium aquaticum]|uniref:Porin n=1 Tax=Histidinibacterium aquaticum TaxID=2613962 RepID=A0A5J5GIW1_9RHOB|nr:hypothetical protein [Histidinibacterium aquaticum]KAA9008095.1 hypothetical protein F3S47_11350 [Histidinibacterium aquaticum]
MTVSALRGLLRGGLLALALPGMAAAQEFLQYDVSPSDSTLVASATRGAYGASLTYSRFTGGGEATVSATRGFAVPVAGAPATLRVGPSVLLSEDDSPEAGLKIVAEQYRPTNWGGLFLLAEATTVNSGYFAMVQPNLANGVSFEITAAGNSEGYRERALAVTRRLGDGPWRLRAGYRFVAEEVFVGASLNTY